MGGVLLDKHGRHRAARRVLYHGRQLVGRRGARIMGFHAVEDQLERFGGDLNKLADLYGREWVQRDRMLGNLSTFKGLPLNGLGGIAGAIQPNTEPTTAPGAQTGGTAEVGVWGASTAPPAYAQIPVGSIRAPSFLILQASGIITSSAAAQTAAFTARWGSSATLTSNPSLGATGAMSLGASSAQTNMIWLFEAFVTVRRLDVGGGATASQVIGAVNCMIGNTAGAAAASVAGVGGITAAATFDALAVQGVGISVTPSAAGVSAQLLQYCLIAID